MQHHPGVLSLSKDETLLVSSSGDVLACRCRLSPYPQPYQWHDECVAYCEADCDDLSTQLQDTSLCTWSTQHKGGLRGGAPAQIAMPLQTPQSLLYENGVRQELPEHSPSSQPNVSLVPQQAFLRPALANLESDEEEVSMIVPIRSFDYSHFEIGGNDMISEMGLVSPRSPSFRSDMPFFHGVPSFLPAFRHVKIKQISAHPLGSHVLLISAAGLLYSYGLNDYGQLGIGVKTPVTGFHRGYIVNPTIVTPLVEHGGKAVACAAGVNHSLVVVMTEEHRLVKSSSPDTILKRPSELDSVVVYHQIYGFGRNDSLKIGLVSPKMAHFGGGDNECVLLPRRVALRCKIRTSVDENHPPQGIFDVQASEEHSSALVRRASGDVEVYTWGNAMYGALGLPQPSAAELPDHDEPVNIVPVPSFVACLSKTSNLEAAATSLLLEEEEEYPCRVSLGRRCSFVVSSLGRCFSFGTSEEGMLGLGPKITISQRPTEITLPVKFCNERIRSVRAGASHVLACSDQGNVFAWGSREYSGLQSDLFESVGGEYLDNTEWSPKLVELCATNSGKANVVEVCAGFDCSFFVFENGEVHSCGRNSGRLGLGECQDSVVGVPRPLFGGLHLWQRHDRRMSLTALRRSSDVATTTRPRAAPVLKRGISIV